MSGLNKILVFGGAFNPPHVGHLQILQKAIDFIKPQQTLVCVDKISPWKDSSMLVPYSYRVNMVNNLFIDKIKYVVYVNKNNLIYKKFSDGCTTIYKYDQFGNCIYENHDSEVIVYEYEFWPDNSIKQCSIYTNNISNL